MTRCATGSAAAGTEQATVAQAAATGTRRGRPSAATASIAVVLGALGVAAPAPLAAQTQVALAAHASRDFALPGAPYLYGGTFATYAGIVGVRVGGAIGELRDIERSGGDSRLELGAWTADADFVIAPGQSRAIRAALGGLGPYGFVGIGTQGVRREVGGTRESGPVWSYGVGLAQPLLGALYFDAEARYRIPIVNDGVQPPAGFTRAREYRLGLSLRFGGGGGGRRGRGHGGDWERAREP
jgi:hypothetical protein